MGFESTLGVIGVVATFVFGIVGILIVRKKRYNGKVSILLDNNIELYDSKIKDIQGISILYNNKIIEKNMSLLSLYVINLGSIDITEEMTSNELQFNLPTEFQILNSQVIESSPNLVCNIVKASNYSLIFKLSLFKINEYFKFEVLIETEIPKNVLQSINFTHRIAHTADVDEIKIDPEIKNSKHRSNKLRNLITIIVLLLISTSLLINYNYNTSKNALDRELTNYGEYSGLFNEIIHSGTPLESVRLMFPTEYAALDEQFKLTKIKLDNYNIITHLFKPEGRISIGLLMLFLGISAYFQYKYFDMKNKLSILKIINNV